MNNKKNEELPLSVDELVKRYGSPDQVETLLNLRALASFLHETVLYDDYKPSSELTGALGNLSDEGKRIRTELGQIQQQNRDKYKNARLPLLSQIYALLNLLHRTPLLDLEKTDPDSVARAIATEVQDSKLHFAFLFGREVYDHFNEIQEDETAVLSYDKTVKLLDKCPIGVVHLRRYLIGPWGLIKTPFTRNVGARVDPFLQHSSDRAVLGAHRVRLTTSYSADVNVYQSLYYESLTRTCSDPSAWGSYFRRVASTPLDDFDERSIVTIPYLLGDAFSTAELELIYLKLVNNSAFAKECADSFLGSAQPEELQKAMKQLDRAKLFQLLLCGDDQELWDAVTELVQDEEISVPPGEIRKAVLNGRRSSGQWGVSLELSSLGLRNNASIPGFAPQRFEYLVKTVWEKCGTGYHEDIRWRLRGHMKVDSAQDVIQYARTRPVSRMVQELFNFSKRALEECSSYLRIKILETDDDEVVVKRIMWALGFSIDHPDYRAESFWEKRSRVSRDLKNRILSSRVEPTPRSIFADFFPAAEDYLRQTLCYLTWAFLGDHFASHEGLVYKETYVEEFTAKLLFEGDIDALRKLTLGKFESRFSQLAKKMQSALDDPDANVRPFSELPRFVNKTNLQSFPFRYKPLVLCIESDCAKQATNKVRAFAELFSKSQISITRNGLHHGGDRLPTDEKIRTSLNLFAEAIESLETWGLTPVSYRKEATEYDGSNRGRITYVSSQGLIHYEFRPSETMLAGLPTATRRILVMPKIQYKGTLQSVLFQAGYDSQYAQYWANYPKIPENSEFLPLDGASTSDKDE